MKKLWLTLVMFFFLFPCFSFGEKTADDNDQVQLTNRVGLSLSVMWNKRFSLNVYDYEYYWEYGILSKIPPCVALSYTKINAGNLYFDFGFGISRTSIMSVANTRS